MGIFYDFNKITEIAILTRDNCACKETNLGRKK